MARTANPKGFMMYASYDDFFEVLEDDELGLLCRLLIRYSKGQEIDLCGIDRAVVMAFKYIIQNIDRDTESYAKKVKANQENGAYGGRPKRENTENPAVFSETQENPTVFSETQKTQYKLKDKDKLENKDELTKGRLPGTADAASAPEAVIQLPLNDNSLYPIGKDDVKAWTELYPAVDVLQELRKMVGWLESHASRRKTKRGVRAFITGWLAREQDKGGKNKGGSPPAEREPERDYSKITFYDPLSEMEDDEDE